MKKEQDNNIIDYDKIFHKVMEQLNENVQPLDNKQNTDSNLNNDYNKKYNHIQYM